MGGIPFTNDPTQVRLVAGPDGGAASCGLRCAAADLSALQHAPHAQRPPRDRDALFGKLKLSSPRLYTCACQADDIRCSSRPLVDLLPERITPELRYLETK